MPPSPDAISTNQIVPWIYHRNTFRPSTDQADDMGMMDMVG